MEIKDSLPQENRRRWTFAIWTVSGLIPGLILILAMPFIERPRWVSDFWVNVAGTLMSLAAFGGPFYLLAWSFIFVRRKVSGRLIMRILAIVFLTVGMCVLNIVISFAGCTACGKITGHEFPLN